MAQRFAVSFLIAVKAALLIESTREGRTLILWRVLLISYTSAETEFQKDQRTRGPEQTAGFRNPLSSLSPSCPIPHSSEIFRGQTYKQYWPGKVWEGPINPGELELCSS